VYCGVFYLVCSFYLCMFACAFYMYVPYAGSWAGVINDDDDADD